MLYRGIQCISIGNHLALELVSLHFVFLLISSLKHIVTFCLVLLVFVCLLWLSVSVLSFPCALCCPVPCASVCFGFWLLLSPPPCQAPHLSLVCSSAPSQVFLVSPCSFILPVVPFVLAWCSVSMSVDFVILFPVISVC